MVMVSRLHEYEVGNWGYIYSIKKTKKISHSIFLIDLVLKEL